MGFSMAFSYNTKCFRIKYGELKAAMHKLGNEASALFMEDKTSGTTILNEVLISIGISIGIALVVMLSWVVQVKKEALH